MYLRWAILFCVLLQTILVSFSNASKQHKNHDVTNNKNKTHINFLKKQPAPSNATSRSNKGVQNKQKWTQPKVINSAIQEKHTANRVKKTRRSNGEEAIEKSMLQLDASNGFQNAIETDMTELDSPRDLDHTKRQAMYEVVSSPFTNNNTHSGNDDSRKSYELVSQTAQYYSNYITDEMRILKEIQINNDSCDDNQNGYNPCVSSTNKSVEENHNQSINSSANNTQASENSTIIGENATNCHPWSAWSSCSSVCGDGISTRYRDCYDKNGTKSPQHQVQYCSDQNCKYCTEWSKWSSCSKVCGIGVRFKQRTCYFNDGSKKKSKQEEFCNTQSCETKCGNWSEWGNCTKPCDGGVSMRYHNCDLPDGTTKAFYEHRICNPQPCVVTYPPEHKNENDTSDSNHTSTNDSCLSSYIGFEKFHDALQTIYDEGPEHNDIEITQALMFNGNYSCGYCADFEKPYSYLKFYDDIFRTFDKKDIALAFWMNMDKNPFVSQKQTIFYLTSNSYDVGQHMLEIREDQRLRYLLMDKQLTPIREGISEEPLSLNTWVHVYIEYSNELDKLKLVVNGKISQVNFTSTDSVTTIQFVNETVSNLNSNFQAFGNNPSLDQPFRGLIDEIYIYKCPLQLSEVKNVANTCRYRNSLGCPSPLEGLCDDCPFCLERSPENSNHGFETRPTPEYHS